MNAPPRKKRNSTKVNLIISAVFHSLIIGALLFFAAREGLLGKQLRKIAVQMAPKEKPPEKKPEEKKPEEPKPVEPKAEPKVAEAPRIVQPPPVVKAPTVTAPPAMAPPPAVAPPVADAGTFNFVDPSAKQVQSTSDPVEIYKGMIEYALRSKWNRPENMDDGKFVALVDVTIDPTGKIAKIDWRQGSGDTRWDDSVRRAIQQTASINRPPPKNFPAKILVRFDTQEEVEQVPAFGQP